MAKDFAKAFYNSRRWQQCKKSYIDQRVLHDGGMCEECRTNPGFIVHHRIILTEENITNPEVSLNHDNLEYVCKECHDRFEGHGVGHGRVKPLFVFDSDGQPVSMREVDSPP